MKATTRSLTLAILALLAGCGVPAELKPYQTATLEPGAGLGDLRLGQTSLGATLPRFREARISVLASDYYGFELNLAGGDLSLLFLTGEDDPCKLAASQRSMPDLSRDLAGLLAAEPACGALTLHSLAVSGDFYQGATSQGIRLGDGLVASAQGAVSDLGDMSDVATEGTSELQFGSILSGGMSIYSSQAPGEEDAPVQKIVVYRRAD